MIRPFLEPVVIDAPGIVGLGARDHLVHAVGHGRPSHAHIAAIGLPEAAHGSLGDAALTALGLAAAHLQDSFLFRGAGDAALNKTADAAVLHRNVAGRADQIVLLVPDHPLLTPII